MDNEIRLVPISRKQLEAIGGCASIANRMGSSYEIYGGVNVQQAVEITDEIDWAWREAPAVNKIVLQTLKNIQNLNERS